MKDAAGAILGVRLRRSNGSKFAVTGGREGLFLPSMDTADRRLFVCEGPKDVAAMLDMGFFNIVGRPSCTGGINLLVDLARRRRPKEVAVMSDEDEPGRRGADNLASVLVAYVPVVRVILPPDGIKDVRQWLQAGGDRLAVETAIVAAPARRLVIETRRVAHGRK
jgi:DNA primase